MKTCHVITGMSAMLVSVYALHAQTITPYFSIRSQGLNTPRHISGVLPQTVANREFSGVHGTFCPILEYSRSFHPHKITNALLGTEDSPALTISGSRVTSRGTHDWLADYFYLPTDFKSAVSFKPGIDNVILDLNFYLGLDEWTPGLFLELYLPLVHSRWNLHMCEQIEAKGTNTHDSGYFTADTIQRNNLLNSFSEYANGYAVDPINQTVAGTDFTVIFQSLQKARMSACAVRRTRFADFRMVAGYNFVRNDQYQVAFQAVLSAPAGTRPEGTYLFEPTIGNGHHWELGAGFTGSVTLWQSSDEEQQLILFGDLTATHLFYGRQRRTFDLKGKPFSRYMLVEKLGTPISDNLQGNGTTPTAQFQHEFLPVANISNLSIDTEVAFQAECTASLTYAGTHINWDVGYNFWGQTCEHSKLSGLNPFDNNTTLALKGDSHVYGFDRGVAGAGPLEGAVPLSATQSSATIYGGNNFVSANTVAQAKLNPGIDYPQNATGDAVNATASNPLSSEPYQTALSIKTSINPIFLKTTDLDPNERKTKGLSNSVFTHVSYRWTQHADWIPYLGIGAQVEFGYKGNCTTNSSSCPRCVYSPLSQWAFWCKGGISF